MSMRRVGAAILCSLAISATAGPSDAVLTDAFNGLSPDQAALASAPLQDWQKRADTAAASASISPEELVPLLALGGAMRPAGRDLPAELARRLGDSDLGRAFDTAKAARSGEPGLARARAALANAILARPSLAELHDSARLERARMALVTDDNRERVLAAFRDAVDGAVTDEGAREAVACLSALHGPQYPEDFAATGKLLDLAIEFHARLQAIWIASPVIRTLEESGWDDFAPDAWNGDPQPALGAMRAAFELGRTPQLEAGLEALQSWHVAPEVATELTYWTAMDHFANARYDLALKEFDEAEALNAGTFATACSAVRAGQALLLKRSYFDAAVRFSMAAETYTQFPDAAHEAEVSFKYLVDAGLADSGRARAEAASRLEKRTIALK